MTGTGLSPLEFVLWIILANTLFFASVYGAVQWMRKSSIARLNQVEEQLQHYENRVRGILDFLQKYNTVNAEPFLTPLQKLSQDTQDIGERLQNLDNTAKALRADIETPATNRYQNIINAPYDWFQRWRQSKDILTESSSLDRHLAEIEQQMPQIQDLPWRIALQIRHASIQITEMARLAQNLQSRGVLGRPFESALARIPVGQRALATIPAKFLNAGQNELLASTSPYETIQVFEALCEVQPIYERWLPYLKDWDLSLQTAFSEISTIQRTTIALHRLISQPPSGLRTEPIQDRLQQLTSMSAELEKNLSRPQVDQLKNLMREATRIRKLSEDAGKQINKAGERAAELSQVLIELRSGLDTLASQFKSLAEKENRPLITDESGEELKKLQQQLSQLGPASQARTPDQISKAIETTSQIRTKHQALVEKFQKIAQQYNTLVALLDSVELNEGAAWAYKAREMITLASGYDPGHWSKQDLLESLQNDLAALNTLQEKIIPAGQAVPVKETRLDQMLKEAQQLASMHKSLRPRVDATRTRLENIQSLEKEGKEKLTGAWNALERASILANNNDLLRDIADADIKRLTDELKRLSDALNNRKQGLIEKKVQQIQSQYGSVIQAVQTWIAALDSENQAIAHKINQQLSDLDNIASLEDPPFQEARRLTASPDLRSRPVTGALRNPIAPKILPSEQELSAEIKRKSDLWQALVSSSQALDENCRTILEAYRETLDSRTQAQSLLGEVSTQFSQRRVWPPHNQQPLPENQGISQVDARWDAMRKQHVRADWTILELGRLANQYNAISERAKQLLDRIVQDQDRIFDLEEQLEDLKQRWAQLAQESPDNPILFQSVQQLLSRADSQLAYIRMQYMRGMIHYDDALQNLRLLIDEIMTSRVQFDERRDIALSNQRKRDQTIH